MLPDFPKIKLKFQEELTRYLRNLIRQEPLLSQIRQVRMFEGNKLSTRDETGEIDKSPFQDFSAELQIDRKDIIAKGILAYLEKLTNVAEQIQKQQAKMVFENIEKVTKRIGNVVDGRGRPFDFEMFYEGIEKVQIEFDDTGKPHLPTFFVDPKLGAKIKEMMPQWQQNKDYERQMTDLLNRKKVEWNDRESNRKLVD
jgi:hypothetical protein